MRPPDRRKPASLGAAQAFGVDRLGRRIDREPTPDTQAGQAASIALGVVELDDLQQLRVSIEPHRIRERRLQIRLWYRGRGERAFRPSPRAIALPLGRIPSLLGAMTAALSEARRLGLIEEDRP